MLFQPMILPYRGYLRMHHGRDLRIASFREDLILRIKNIVFIKVFGIYFFNKRPYSNKRPPKILLLKIV